MNKEKYLWQTLMYSTTILTTIVNVIAGIKLSQINETEQQQKTAEQVDKFLNDYISKKGA